MPSIRSAAELNAATIAAWVAWRARPRRRGRPAGRRVLLQPLELLAGFRQLVGDHQRRHDGQPRIADLAELSAQRDDRSSRSLASCRRWSSWPSSQAMRNWRPLMVTFTCARCPSIGCDLEHGRMLSIAASSRRAMSRLAAFSLRTLRELRVEVGGELGAVGAERVHLLGEGASGCGRFRSCARPRRRAHPAPASSAGCGFDRGLIGHRSPFMRGTAQTR